MDTVIVQIASLVIVLLAQLAFRYRAGEALAFPIAQPVRIVAQAIFVFPKEHVCPVAPRIRAPMA